MSGVQYTWHKDREISHLFVGPIKSTENEARAAFAVEYGAANADKIIARHQVGVPCYGDAYWFVVSRDGEEKPMWTAKIELTDSGSKLLLGGASEEAIRVETGPGYVQVLFNYLRVSDLQAIRDACESGIGQLKRERERSADNDY
jgi:hypothetical protein